MIASKGLESRFVSKRLTVSSQCDTSRLTLSSDNDLLITVNLVSSMILNEFTILGHQN